MTEFAAREHTMTDHAAREHAITEHILTYPQAHDFALANLLNPVSRRRVHHLGIGLTGARVMEVGCGGGSFALWLAGQVGDTGRVYAVDRDPRFDSAPPHVEIMTADVTTADLPGMLDLIHARLTLNHIRQRAAALTNLVNLLVPAGGTPTEDRYSPTTAMVMYA